MTNAGRFVCESGTSRDPKFKYPNTEAGREAYLGNARAVIASVRLVLDTGIHSKRWTREQAIAYFPSNSSVSDTDIAREVDRYFNWPGQATSYMVGQLTIAELRARAERELGAGFDVRDFHEAVLSQGALPLSVLEEQVVQYIVRRRQ